MTVQGDSHIFLIIPVFDRYTVHTEIHYAYRKIVRTSFSKAEREHYYCIDASIY